MTVRNDTRPKYLVQLDLVPDPEHVSLFCTRCRYVFRSPRDYLEDHWGEHVSCPSCRRIASLPTLPELAF